MRWDWLQCWFCSYRIVTRMRWDWLQCWFCSYRIVTRMRWDWLQCWFYSYRIVTRVDMVALLSMLVMIGWRRLSTYQPFCSTSNSNVELNWTVTPQLPRIESGEEPETHFRLILAGISTKMKRKIDRITAMQNKRPVRAILKRVIKRLDNISLNWRFGSRSVVHTLDPNRDH